MAGGMDRSLWLSEVLLKKAWALCAAFICAYCRSGCGSRKSMMRDLNFCTGASSSDCVGVWLELIVSVGALDRGEVSGMGGRGGRSYAY